MWIRRPTVVVVWDLRKEIRISPMFSRCVVLSRNRFVPDFNYSTKWEFSESLSVYLQWKQRDYGWELALTRNDRHGDGDWKDQSRIRH